MVGVRGISLGLDGLVGFAAVAVWSRPMKRAWGSGEVRPAVLDVGWGERNLIGLVARKVKSEGPPVAVAARVCLSPNFVGVEVPGLGSSDASLSFGYDTVANRLDGIAAALFFTGLGLTSARPNASCAVPASSLLASAVDAEKLTCFSRRYAGDPGVFWGISD